jgi:hypothetical protein
MKIISSKSDGKTFYVERYEDDAFGFRPDKRDATRFDVEDIDRVLRRLYYEYPDDINNFKVVEEPMTFRIAANNRY